MSIYQKIAKSLASTRYGTIKECRKITVNCDYSEYEYSYVPGVVAQFHDPKTDGLAVCRYQLSPNGLLVRSGLRGFTYVNGDLNDLWEPMRLIWMSHERTTITAEATV